MEGFIELHKQLLKEERDAEIKECIDTKSSLPVSELQSRGVCITKLHVVSLKTGLYGRTVIKLGLRGGPDRPLPSNNFSSGDIVDAHLKHCDDLAKSEIQGVVTSVKDTSISVALEGEDSRTRADELSLSGQSLLLFKTANEVTYRRLQKGLECLNHHSGPSSQLIDVCFGVSKPTMTQGVRVEKFYNSNLNPSQRAAVEFALSAKELAVVHGPPGTGKTTTVVELIAQMVSMGQKVLTCAPSNVAVDNILEKLASISIVRFKSTNQAPGPIKVVRLGHPARMLSKNLHHLSLDALIAKSDAATIVQDVRKEIDLLYSKFRKKHNKQDQYKLREERKFLRKELREREKKCVREILSSADVVLATNVGSHGDGPLKHLQSDHFPVVVIDECGQALEASCWIPMLYARKCILAGDHLQLPPTVKSKSASDKGLSKTLLERVVNLHGSEVIRMLNVQYRMNSKIMNWSSDNMYQSKLEAHVSVEDHLLTGLPNVEETEDTLTPLLLIDTTGCNMAELQTVDNDSVGNPSEANVVANHVSVLIEAGIEANSIAVISPYNMQVDILRKLLREKYPGLEIKSVDGFQGREKEAVVLSLVRSNEKGVIGFLSDDRRMNVAVTRARRHLALICDSSTVCKHPFLETLIKYMNENGEVRSAHEFSNLDTVEGAQFDAAAFVHAAVKKEEPKGSKNEIKSRDERKDLSKVKEKYRKILLKFVAELNKADENQIYEFPQQLKSFERLAVHELCEELGLKHESIGEGKERRIIVSKMTGKSEPTEILHVCNGDTSLESLSTQAKLIEDHPDDLNLDNKQENDENVNELGNEASNADMVTPQLDEPVQAQDQIQEICPICHRKLPQQNMQLHTVNCQRLKAMKEKLDASKQQAKAKTKKPPKSKKKSKNKSMNAEEKDDEELLEEAMRINKLCGMLECDQSVVLVGQMCASCKKSYCLEHHIPELHGCGAAVHSSARQQIARDGMLYSGSGVPSKKLPPHKHGHLQRKLNTKLKELEEKRKAVKKNG